MMKSNKKYKILLARTSYDAHLNRFVRRLKQYNPDVTIDVLTSVQKKEIPDDIKQNASNVYFYKLTGGHIVSHLAFLKYFLDGMFLRRAIKKMAKDSHYDIINIHYPTMEFASSIKAMRSMADNIILSPWGSDVYRISKWQQKRLKRLYQDSDWITGLDNRRFWSDIAKLFDVPIEKFVHLNIASETVDYMASHLETISQEKAKKIMKVEKQYVITCGYNGNPAQQHKAVITAIARIKNQLPSNFVLIFPVTYGGNKKYIDELKADVSSNGINAVFLERYMNMEEMFYLVQATDVFIHIQTTDSDSLCVKEYLFCKKKVVHGSWIEYDDFKKYPPEPFYKVDRLSDLDSVIVDAVNGPARFASNEWWNEFKNSGYNYWMPKWDSFYQSLLK